MLVWFEFMWLTSSSRYSKQLEKNDKSSERCARCETDCIFD